MASLKIRTNSLFSLIVSSSLTCSGCARTDGGAPVEMCHGRPYHHIQGAKKPQSHPSDRGGKIRANTLDPHPTTPIRTNIPPFAHPITHERYRDARKVYTQDGVLVPVNEGTPFMAIASGAVIFAGSDSELGNAVIVRHPNEWVSVYAHAQTLNVSTGSIVKKGQVLGKTGQSGRVNTPGLHLEVRHHNKIVSPKNLY